MRRAIIACGLLVLGSTAADATPSHETLQALIECRANMAALLDLAPLPTTLQEGASIGWLPLPSDNPFMVEFALARPIQAYGHSSSHIAISGSSIMAILDLPDPRPLAQQLQLEAGLDTPQKVMFGREVRSEVVSEPGSAMTMIESAVISVSNVTSHPGKTLAGCSYSLDQA
jgi:hypothetical protein